MSSVVSFLTMLERDVSEANGNVRRMLSVCAEFERIARVALDRSEREIRGRGKRKQTEREREKALKDGGSGGVAQGLEDGKSLEQMQVETQAAYRRPVNTPSLRQSTAGSQHGSQAGNSPASWGGSPPGGTGPEYHAPLKSQQQRHQRQNSHSNGQVQQSPYMSSPDHGTFNPMTFQGMPGNVDNAQYQQHNQPSFPGGFSGPPPMEFAPQPGFSPPPGADAAFMPPPFTGDVIQPISGVGASSFQQPFVPQDLWQMPMTLEWDWAEGLGLGSFTPGPMFDMHGGQQGMGPGAMAPPPPQQQ